MSASTFKSATPELRIRDLNQQPIHAGGSFVLYWMIASRRTGWNFALQRAAEWAKELAKPLVVFEPLRCGYPWASDRLHAFVIEGMADNAASLASKPVSYFPYLEPEQAAGSGLLAVLAKQACLVVTDDFPCFIFPRMTEVAAARCGVRMEAIDSNGLFPMRATDRVFLRAHDFRRFLKKNLRPHLEDFPKADPLRRLALPKLDHLPREIHARWPAANLGDVKRAERNGNGDFDSQASIAPAFAKLLRQLPIDHKVGPASFRGGSTAATAVLKTFLEVCYTEYGDGRNHPDQSVSSGLSPYLHFGHISAHQVVQAVFDAEEWTPNGEPTSQLGDKRLWDHISELADAFLDQLVTWRELGFNMCCLNPDYDKFESLPNWALDTLQEHAGDKRSFIYSLDDFEGANTHDDIWNAAQRQLVREGRMHNYLRMLWGKKILEWTASPRAALEVMIELNNKYAVDGRDPNSYSGIFWTLGRYDRAWGPERSIFGKVRYMSSDNTKRKLKLEKYLAKYGD